MQKFKNSATMTDTFVGFDKDFECYLSTYIQKLQKLDFV